jgi:hypothetical protein
MFDDCNDFFKRKADGRVRPPMPVGPLLPEGIVPALLLSVVDRAQTQYLHRTIAVLS